MKYFLLPLLLFYQHSMAEIIDGEIIVDNAKRTYHLFLPDENSTAKIPLVIVFHGGGGDGQGMIRFTKFNDLAEDENFLVLYPDGENRSWNDGRTAPDLKAHSDDVKFIDMLIDEMIAQHYADAEKIFITGISNGAIFSLYLASKLNGKIRAVAAVCGSIPTDYASTYHLNNSLSIMLINGTEDPLIKYNGGNIGSQRWERGVVIPTDSVISKLVLMLGCSSTATESDLADINLKDHCHATKYIYTNCKANTDIILIKVTGGGHTWPGGLQYLPKSMIGRVCRDFNATSEIWKFFRQQYTAH